jgi:uncharacterized membrane protein YeaQ/YmgE (transglycosylase-associated protein family)
MRIGSPESAVAKLAGANALSSEYFVAMRGAARWNFSRRRLLDGGPHQRRRVMEEAGIGWIAAIIIGGIAGWLAELITRSNMGIFANVVLGVIGAGLATWLFGLMDIRMQAGWLSFLISGFVGASVLIVATRLIYPARWRM